MAQLSENKLKLLEMEAEGRFVFHGSGDELEILEPRQAENFIDEARHSRRAAGGICVRQS